MRIVAGQDDQPEWMVTADETSGAASRRMNSETQTVPHAAQPTAQKKSGEHHNADGKRASAHKVTLSKKARKRRAKRMKRAAGGILAVGLVTALVIASFIGVGRLLDIKRTLDSGDGVFYPNIYVNSIPLEGLSLDDAYTLVNQQVASLVSSWKITMCTQDGRSWDITGADLNMKYDVADQLDQLWSIGHSGSSSARYQQVKALEEQAVERYTTLTYDMTKVTQILTQIKEEIDKPAVNATRVPDSSKWPPFSYTDDVPGVQLNTTELNERICGMVDRLQSGTVELTPTPMQASVTRQYLEGQIVQLSTYDTLVSTTSEAGRFINIRVGTEKFNHLTIKPNESVSFNKVTGLRTLENGYAVAPELAYNSYVDGVGGGICQVSSTLYNAVVNAGLKVTTRTQHSLASSYVPLGQDATVQDNRLDLVFVNNTGADLYISSQYYKGSGGYHCSFTIHGRPDPNGYTYRLESKIIEEIPRPEPTIVPDVDALYVVYDDETHEVDGHRGYVVEVYLVTYDKNGLEIARTLDHTDTYNAVTPRIYVGVTPRETPAPTIEYY